MIRTIIKLHKFEYMMAMNKLNVKKQFLILTLIIISFLCSVANTKAYNSIVVQKEYDGLDIDYVCAGPNSKEKDRLDIEADVKDADTGELIEENDMKVHKYHVYKDKYGKEEILDGNLEYDKDDKEWKVLNIDLFWTGNGEFFITVEFQTKDMNKPVETDIDDSEKHKYTRASIWEIVIVASTILGIVFGVVILIVGMRMKRQGVSVERKVKEPKKKEVKFKTLSEAEIKQAKKEKKKEKKEKGKTEVSEDLIFSVPQWEVDDDDEGGNNS
ncbi:MAG: hypothetical protein ACTSR8_18880 [Promethearchaeota archaeon]